jgi:hypothetical protein
MLDGQLSEASRRARWIKMQEQQKRALGLGRSTWFGSRYHALGSGYGYGYVEVEAWGPHDLTSRLQRSLLQFVHPRTHILT